MEVVISICLIGRHLCGSWDRVRLLFAGTLRSVLAQSSPRFQLIVACNEVPEGDPIFADRRITYIVLPKVGRDEIAKTPYADIWVKEHATRKWASESPATYFFPVDQDDLVSNRLVEHVVSASPRAGFIVRDGYALDYRTGRLGKVPTDANPGSTFDQWCGSSIVVSMNPMLRAEARHRHLNEVFRHGHSQAAARIKSVLGDEPADVPFPAAIYRLNNGENFSQAGTYAAMGIWNRDIDQWIFDTPVPSDDALRAEFGL